MRENCTSGTVPGAPGNRSPYGGGYPEVAKKDRARVFRDLYDSIFNSKLTTQHLLVPLRLYEEIHGLKRDLQRKVKKNEPFDASLLFLIDGGYHILFAVHELCEAKNIDAFDETEAAKQIPMAVDLVKRLVNDEMASDAAFTTNRYFKDTKTKAQVQRVVVLTTTSKSKKKATRSKPSHVRRKRR